MIHLNSLNVSVSLCVCETVMTSYPPTFVQMSNRVVALPRLCCYSILQLFEGCCFTYPKHEFRDFLAQWHFHKCDEMKTKRNKILTSKKQQQESFTVRLRIHSSRSPGIHSNANWHRHSLTQAQTPTQNNNKAKRHVKSVFTEPD